MNPAEALIRSYWEGCWNTRDLDRLGTVFHEPYMHNRAELTIADHAEIIAETTASFPDLQVWIDDLEVVGNAVITRCRFVGTHGGPIFGIDGTGRSIAAPTLDVFFLRDGRVDRLWHLTDHLPILRGIGSEANVAGRPVIFD
jgi:predicted ester cyclase